MLDFSKGKKINSCYAEEGTSNNVHCQPFPSSHPERSFEVEPIIDERDVIGRQSKSLGENAYLVDFPSDEVGECPVEPAAVKPEDEDMISLGISNLLQLKRPRLTWVEEEVEREGDEAIKPKRFKGEIDNMEWETDDFLLEESYMAEEAGLSTPPTSP